MSTEPETQERFEVLRSRVGADLLGLWDVYVGDKDEAVYIPISNKRYREVTESREQFLRDKGLRFVGSEAAYLSLTNREPRGGRKSGSFRRLDWFDDSFNRTTKPRVMDEIERRLEKDSAWLSGGPRPNLADQASDAALTSDDLQRSRSYQPQPTHPLSASDPRWGTSAGQSSPPS